MSLQLYLFTISFLKARQVYFQILFPIKRFLNTFRSYNKFIHLDIKNVPASYFPIIDHQKNKGEHKFTLLNIEHDFRETIDWNISIHGKLWNYKLQYLDFLLDPDLEVGERNEYLLDISKKILDKSLTLEPYPVSLRLVNSLLFINQCKVEDELICQAILKQIHFLESNLEYHIDGNHLLENAITLRFCCQFISNEKLKSFAKKFLSTLLKEQILNDGAHFERSPMYHFQILNRLTTLIGVLDISESDYNEIIQYLQKMYSWLIILTRSGKYFPFLQDSTGNYLKGFLKLEEFLISKGLEKKFCELKDSGYRILESDKLFAIANIVSTSPSFQPGHSHADAGSFVLYYKDSPVFVDRGISTYEVSETRSLERSTAGHNTVNLNGKNQSEMWSSFRVGRRARTLLEFESKRQFKLSCKPFYNSLVEHNRNFEFMEQSLIIIDSVSGYDNEICEARLYCDHACSVENNEHTVKVNGLWVRFENALHLQLISYQQALDFNLCRSATCIVISFRNSLTTRIHV
ncbi:MAG: alginate lyase family protein [Saprospiraceae bacterium]|nr:alginate lyase family protein [Saprospiraceae bacterium]